MAVISVKLGRSCGLWAQQAEMRFPKPAGTSFGMGNLCDYISKTQRWKTTWPLITNSAIDHEEGNVSASQYGVVSVATW